MNDETRSWLREAISERFGLEDIRSLCFDIGVDYENLGGEGKESKIRELIITLERRNKLPDLILYCQKKRPEFTWELLNAEETRPKASQGGQIPVIVTNITVQILFLAANPVGTGRLSLDVEFREIEHTLRSTDQGAHFQSNYAFAVQPQDVAQEFLHVKPHIVHFSGHGSEEGEIILQDDLKSAHPVKPETLAKLFHTLRDNIRCVVLNACWTAVQAQAIAQEIECVVGMSRSITDEAAINFARGFYRGVGFSRSVREAYELGMTEISLFNLPEDAIPQLISRTDSDPATIRFGT